MMLVSMAVVFILSLTRCSLRISAEHYITTRLVELMS